MIGAVPTETPIEDAPLVPGGDAKQPKASYFEGVQCLRFVAALVVVTAHSTFYARERLDPAIQEWHPGTAGVNIFFVISGFVMMTTAPRFAGLRHGWASFGLRRLARIVPLYWLATTLKLATMLAAPAAVLHAKLDWLYVLKSYFFIPAYNVDGAIEPLLGVGWTLLFEMFFYMLCTLALAVRANIILFCSIVLGACFLGSFFRPAQGPAALLYFNPIMIEFIFGMAIAKWNRRVWLPLPICLLLIVAGAFVLLFHPFERIGLITLSRSIPAAMIVLAVVGLERRVATFPRLFVFLGAASYSLYLMHPLIAPLGPTILAKIHLPIATLSVLLSLALAIGLSMVMFRLFERPVGEALNKRVSRLRWNAPKVRLRPA